MITKQRIIISLSIAMLLCKPSLSQEEPETLLNSEREIIRSFFMAPEVKYTTLIDEWEYFGGLRFGFLIDHRYVLGLEVNGILSENAFRGTATVEGETDINNAMYYGGLYLDYIIPTNFPVQISFPLLLGAGGNFLFEKFDNIQQPDAEILEIGKFLVAEPKINLELNISRVFRMGIGCGYRLVGKSNLDRLNNEDLSGFLINVNLKVGSF
jgi:hypothetical protein